MWVTVTVDSNQKLWSDPPLFGGSDLSFCGWKLAVLLASAATPAAAQTSEASSSEIVVIGQRSPLVRPLRTIGGQDLLSYGAGSIGELLDRVVDESGGRSSQATYLVNGKRVTGLGDIDSYPAEALQRVEVLPRESGAAAGAPAGSRVYNIVLKPETRLLVARGQARVATEGGAEGLAADVGATRIARPQRVNLSVFLREDEALIESERNVVQPPGSPPELGRFRSLRPRSTSEEIKLSVADNLLPWLAGLVTSRASQSRNNALLGLSETGAVIERSGQRRALDFTGQLTAERGEWIFTLDSNHRRSRRTDVTMGQPGVGRTWTRARTSSLDLMAHGSLIDLPTGSAHLSIGAVLRRDVLRSRGSEVRESSFSDNAREVRAGLDLPLSSRSGPWPWLGDLALRTEVRRGRSQEFGATSDRTLSLRWSPADWLQLSVQDNRSKATPGAELVGEALLETPGVRYFDPVRRETMDVLALTGGRSDLPSRKFVSRRVSADLRPLSSVDLLLTAEYVVVRNSNVVSVLPPANDLVIQLFPDRFLRDGAGRLRQVDLRPVLFPEQDEEQLRTGFNLTQPIGRGSRRGQLQVSASHRLLLVSRLDVGQGFGTVDLLRRDAIGFGGALQPRQELDFTLGYSERGLGVQLTGTRRGRSFLGGEKGAGVLTFDPLSTFSLRTFVEGSRISSNSAWLRNTRLVVTVTNLANRREKVRNGQDLTPLAYQSVLRDPVGRLVELELRKTF